MRRTGIYTIFFLALAGLFLFAAQSAWAVFTEVSATAAYNDVKDPGTDAVIIYPAVECKSMDYRY